MRLLKRVTIALLSAGWIIPFCMSHWLSQLFMATAVVPAIRDGKPWIGSFDPFPDIDRLFYISMIWLAAVIVTWSVRTAFLYDR
jgi:hypothetical protein